MSHSIVFLMILITDITPVSNVGYKYAVVFTCIQIQYVIIDSHFIIIIHILLFFRYFFVTIQQVNKTQT